MEVARPYFVEWLAVINEFIDHQESINQEATSQAKSIAEGFGTLMIVLCLVVLLIGIGIAVLITRYIIQSLGGEPKEAVKIVTEIAGGDLTTSIQVEENTSMLGSVNKMQSSLRSVFSKYQSQAEVLSATSEELLKIVRDMNRQTIQA